MGGISNGPKIRNKISATFRHLTLPCQNAEKVITQCSNTKKKLKRVRVLAYVKTSSKHRVQNIKIVFITEIAM